MADQLKATASHLYGNRFCETPTMARLASEGVLFQHAFTPHPLCVPARVSFWTGKYSHAHGARRNETFMPEEAAHAFQLWKDAGYHTALIGKNHCFAHSKDRALFDTWCEIGHQGLPTAVTPCSMEWFRPKESIEAAHEVRRNMPRQTPSVSYAVTDYPLEDYSTGLITGQTVRFLENHHEEPFALWVSYPDPHTPYEAPRSYARMFPSEKLELPPFPHEDPERSPERNRVLSRILNIADAPVEDIYGLIGTYYAMVRFLDDGLMQILEALERLGLREKTIIVFCADHGDFVGEHGMTRKGGVFYDCLTRVPLIVSWPGTVPAGQTDESMVNLVDVVPTLLTLQGFDVPDAMQGQPLPTVTNTPSRSTTFSEYGAGGPAFRMVDLEKLPVQRGLDASKASLQWRESEGRRKMVRSRHWKYITDPMGDKDELYDLQHDPWELHNAIDDPVHQTIVEELRLSLLHWSILTEDASPVPLPITKTHLIKE